MMWLERARQSGKCEKCGEEYAQGQPVGVISFNGRNLPSHTLHPDCWLAVGLEAINKIGTRDSRIVARHRSDRKVALHHWAQLNYRERVYRETLEGEKLEKVLSRLDMARDQLRLRMAMFGGVPRGWEKEGDEPR